MVLAYYFATFDAELKASLERKERHCLLCLVLTLVLYGFSGLKSFFRYEANKSGKISFIMLLSLCRQTRATELSNLCVVPSVFSLLKFTGIIL